MDQEVVHGVKSIALLLGPCLGCMKQGVCVVLRCSVDAIIEGLGQPLDVLLWPASPTRVCV